MFRDDVFEIFHRKNIQVSYNSNRRLDVWLLIYIRIYRRKKKLSHISIISKKQKFK